MYRDYINKSFCSQEQREINPMDATVGLLSWFPGLLDVVIATNLLKKAPMKSLVKNKTKIN